VTATLQEKLDTGGSDGNPANQDVIDALGPPRIKFVITLNIIRTAVDSVPV
jgi:hypothetical protein